MSDLPDNISFGTDTIFNLIGEGNFTSIGVLVDENTRKLCYPKIYERLGEHHLIEIKSGESNKNIDTCNEIWDQMTRAGFDRNSLLINLGGGVIGDMGGFCAATYKRGISFVNMPTTLLSQVDASVGGKLGVDFHGLKNHIGLFKDPEHVAISTEFLDTLPEQEVRSGFAEIIKHHLIRDKSGWENLRKTPWEGLSWKELIPHSVCIKSAVVAADPYESGLRKILNLGHTIGHAIESHLLGGHSPVLHGEAVAAGIICENHIAHQRGMLSQEHLEHIQHYILSLFGKVAVPEREHNAIIHQAYQDKKNKQQRIRAVLLEAPGVPKWDVEITAEEIRDSLVYYSSLQM